MRKNLARISLFSCLGLVMLCVAVLVVLALSNRNLPTSTQVTERLSDLEKARLSEILNLRHALGDQAWPGWGQADIPMIVYNQDYAFLVGYPNPPEGWLSMPQQVAQGGAWEAVPGDNFAGQVYYRTPLPDPDATPQNFTVLVGERWVATLQTKEHMEVDFYRDLRANLPGFIQPVVPYRIFWGLLMGESENYIGAMEHEAFHALQGSLAPERLADAELANQVSETYPWADDFHERALAKELSMLVEAIRADTDEEAAEFAFQFLLDRDQRRQDFGLSPLQVDYERQRDWLEGLAKYAELELGRLAATTPGYTPAPEMAADPEFKQYTTRLDYWNAQIDEVIRSGQRADETRFYYGGMAQAVLLDRLAPDWKERAFESGVFLEDLLREAVK